jgi:hypothetical protein
MSADRKFLLIVAVAFVPFAAVMTLLLTRMFGASDLGIHCSRADGARCEIRQSRLLGAAGNSSFEIPESRITAAKTFCAQRYSVSSRSSTSCNVELLLANQAQPTGPVLSFPFLSQAQSATRRLNAYLADPDASSIDLREPVGLIVLLYGVSPVALLAVVLAIRERLRNGNNDIAST